MDRRRDSFYCCFRDALSKVQQARFLESFLGEIRPMALDTRHTAGVQPMRRISGVRDSYQPSNQTMKRTTPWRDNFSVLATTPCRGLSLSR
jgi:hypothetical protein